METTSITKDDVAYLAALTVISASHWSIMHLIVQMPHIMIGVGSMSYTMQCMDWG